MERAPVSCGKLFTSKKAAVQAGECRLEISLCMTCSHIWNTAHQDSPDTVYGDDYYSSKAVSSQAREYQQALAAELDQLVDVGGKTVLEIGCGDGLFLNSLRSLGAAAIGFEPSSTFHIAKQYPGIEVFHEQFSIANLRRAVSTVDIGVMRHVLEHLASPGGLLKSLRADFCGFRGPEFLLLEVPNVSELLSEGLYFDFYNDHIHYFSYPSLDRLLAASGWAVEARLGGDNEFLRLVSVNAGSKAGISAPSYGPENQEERDAIKTIARGFSQDFVQWKEQLANIIEACRHNGRQVAVWGAGSRGVALLSGLGLPGESYEYVVDSDPFKHGKYLPMTPLLIHAPEHLRRCPVDCVLVTSYTYFDEILDQLDWFRSQGGKVIRAYPIPEVV